LLPTAPEAVAAARAAGILLVGAERIELPTFAL
jgi:hypothetical protein